MNLCSLALRTATVYALRNKTWAGARVLDQPVDPIATVSKAAKPLVAVYTGVDTAKLKGRDIFGGDKSIELVLQAYLPANIRTDDGIDIDAGGEGGELVIDLVGRQIEAALMADQGPWAALWRNLVFSVHEVSTRPYLIETAKNVRIVARELVILLETVSSPGFGAVPASGVWPDFLSCLSDEPEVAPLRPLIEAAFKGPDDLPSWQQAAALMGMRDGYGIGINPANRSTPGEAPPITESTITGLYGTDVEGVT